MTQRFSGFSESARLYAKNADIVAVLQKRFQEEVDSLLKGVSQSLRQEFRHRYQQTTSVGYQEKWWYWWLGGAGDKWKVPWIQIVSSSPAIVEPGLLAAYLVPPKGSSNEELDALKDLRNNPLLSRYWKREDLKFDAFAVLELPSHSMEPISEICGPLKTALTAMDEIHQRFSSGDKSKSKEAS